MDFNPPISPANKQPRCPCLLLLDTSSSMQGERIDRLNEALARLPVELRADSLARRRVELSIVTFGPVRTLVPFTLATDFTPPTLVANGNTPLGQAVRHGIELVNARKSEYHAQHLEYFRPLVFLFTDGAPDPGDPWEAAASETRTAEVEKALSMFPIGVAGADMDKLNKFSGRRPAALLKDLRFREFFVWLSNTLGAVANSDPSGRTGAPPTAPSAAAWTDIFG